MAVRSTTPRCAFLSLLLLGCASDSENAPPSGDTASGVVEPGSTTSPDATIPAGSSSGGVDPQASSSGSTSTGDDPPSSTGDESSAGSEETGTETTGETACSLEDLLSDAQWQEMFLHIDDPACPGGGTYSYAGLLAAAANYPTFACEGDEETRLRELVAFLAQISHETTGGWATAPDGPHAWGLCFNAEVGCGDGTCTQYCDTTNAAYPCAPGQTYHGRGAIQLSWNYNYGQAGDALGVDLLADPDQVSTDPELAIATAVVVLDDPTSTQALGARCHGRPLASLGGRPRARARAWIRHDHQHHQRRYRVQPTHHRRGGRQGGLLPAIFGAGRIHRGR